ncbi:MAG: signal recognition particle protein, partial [Methyloceanibacter sp.]
GKVKKQLDAANLDDRILKRQQAMIGSMTRAERKNPKLLNASRKKRGMLSSLFGGGPPPEMPAELPAGASLPPPPGFPGFPAGGFPGMGGMPGLPRGLPRGLPGLPGSKKR